MSVKSNTELGFIGRNEINDAIDPDEHREITKGVHNVHSFIYIMLTEYQFTDHEISHGDGYQKCYTFEEAIRVAGINNGFYLHKM